MLSYLEAIILGIVEGLTEFLPVSSTGHLNLTEKLLGLRVDDPAVTAYTAIIQLGAIAATFLYFWKKIWRLFTAWIAGLRDAEARKNHDYSLAWAVIIGSLPVGIVGYLARNVIEGPLRSLWAFAIALIVWSGVMWVAEQRHKIMVETGRVRNEERVTVKDGLIIGLVQCLSPIPGISRSGATISAGLFRGISRFTATELSFFLAIPALTAAGIYQAVEARHELPGLGFGPMAVGILVSFIVAYASIAWLLRFVRSNSLKSFIWYRVALGLIVIFVLSMGWMQAV